jgi:8-oxo-dGTP pyrophosphatase MutT (NUDIX family)
MERHKITPSVYLFLIKDKQVLLCRRCNTGFCDGQYGLIAGHFEPGESAKVTMQREAKEEAGMEINVNDLELIHVMSRGTNYKNADSERIDLFFTLKKWTKEPTNTEPDKCDDMRWFPLHNLPENMVSYVKKFIECYQKGENYSEFGWE